MRHGKKFNHLGRKAAHRKAMLANMACSLIEHKKIKTTLAKAKALRVYVEPLITKSKNDTTHSRRTVFSYLKQKEAITELFGDIATKVADRPGGYTRILKLSNRLGDNAQMALIELVDYNETYITDKPKKKKTRRRGGAKTSVASVSDVVVDAEETVETTKVDNVETTLVEEAKEENIEGTASEEQVKTTEEPTAEVDSKEETKEEESNESSEEEESIEESSVEVDSKEETKEEESNESLEEEESIEESSVEVDSKEETKEEEYNESSEEEKAD